MNVEVDLPGEVRLDQVKLFCRLQQIETWFREVVYVETKCRYGLTWWEECAAALKRSKRGFIPAEKSLIRDRRHRHMTTRENDLLWFLSFESLLLIVYDSKLWKLFEPYLTTKRLLRAKLEELMPVRNRIAHARQVHRDDLRRVENMMRDLDDGFWKFCTSYNNSHYFQGAHSKDPVYLSIANHHLNKHGRVRADLHFGIRPSSKRAVPARSVRAPGVFYDVYFHTLNPKEYFNVPDMLQHSTALHRHVLHILLDTSQNSVRVTIPAMLDEALIIQTLDRLYQVFGSHTTGFPRLQTASAGDAAGDATKDYEATMKDYEAATVAMARFTSEWPHYIVPAGNPLCFLNPENPCSFFGL